MNNTIIITYIEIISISVVNVIIQTSMVTYANDPVEFYADHPFVFYIKHNGVILFVGKYR